MDGYQALGKVLTTMTQQEVIDIIKSRGCEAEAALDSPPA